MLKVKRLTPAMVLILHAASAITISRAQDLPETLWITERLPLYPTAKNDKVFYLFRDGRNRNNRFVASGTYPAVIYIKQEGSDRGRYRATEEQKEMLIREATPVANPATAQARPVRHGRPRA